MYSLSFCANNACAFKKIYIWIGITILRINFIYKRNIVFTREFIGH